MQTILLIANVSGSASIAEAIQRELDLPVTAAANRRAALTALRGREFALVLMEESFATLDPEGTDLIFEQAGAAPVLELNFAISGTPRILRHIRAAFARRAHDQASARAAAATTLQNELSASLAGLLLESQLALREASPAQAPKLQHLVELASDLRNRLRA